MNTTRMILGLTCFLTFSSLYASEAIGYYSSGSLKNSESILARGTRIHKLFLQRQRAYGTVQMISTISDAADFVRQEFPDSELVQVGDIANVNGGACKEHASHQNGLDADIVYLTRNGRLQSQTAPYWEEDFVPNGVVNANFYLERNLALFKYLVHTQPVDRIFVDQAIKKEFCNYAKENNLLNDPETIETLRRLRVEKLHKTHFHMRLQCSPTDYSCKNQAPVPAGTGC